MFIRLCSTVSSTVAAIARQYHYYLLVRTVSIEQQGAKNNKQQYTATGQYWCTILAWSTHALLLCSRICSINIQLHHIHCFSLFKLHNIILILLYSHLSITGWYLLSIIMSDILVY